MSKQQNQLQKTTKIVLTFLEPLQKQLDKLY